MRPYITDDFTLGIELDIKPAKLQRLLNNLYKMGADTDLNNYEPLGIQWYEIDSVGLFRNNRLKQNIKQGVVKESDIPPIRGFCMCEQDIKYNCVIRHCDSKLIYIIGSCCYKALTEKVSRMRLCSIEGCNQRHRNRNYSLCNDHKMKAIAKEKEKERKLKLGNAVFGFGRKFSGTLIKDIPQWYIDWVKKNNIDNSCVKRLLAYAQ